MPKLLQKIIFAPLIFTFVFLIPLELVYADEISQEDGDSLITTLPQTSTVDSPTSNIDDEYVPPSIPEEEETLPDPLDVPVEITPIELPQTGEEKALNFVVPILVTISLLLVAFTIKLVLFKKN